jgi:branched-chain amino acid transport system ATP-binding protein
MRCSATPPSSKPISVPPDVALLEARALHARYGEIEALHGINLDVAQGSIVALLGANGSGKTTTLRALTGATRSTGSVLFDGREVIGYAPEEVARLGIAHVCEGRGTLSTLSVWENLAMGAYTLSDARRSRARYDKLVLYFPWLAERREQPAGLLSGGEQQMLAIARALMMEPRLILLDEPSLGLAPIIVSRIFEILRAINRDDGVTILIAEQNAAAALALADQAYVLETGRIALRGPSRDLAGNERVRKSYLGY